MEYSLWDEKYNITNDEINYLKYKMKFREIARDYKQKFLKEYRYNNDSILKSVETIVESIFKEPFSIANDILIDNNHYYSSITYISEYNQKYSTEFLNKLCDYYEEYANIINERSRKEEFLEFQKLNRQRFTVGTASTFAEGIKSTVYASGINYVVTLFDNKYQKFNNKINSKYEKQLRNLHDRYFTLLADAVESDIKSLADTICDALFGSEFIENNKFTESKEILAENIFINIKNGKVPNDKIKECLLQILSANPLKSEYYIEAYNRLGDNNGNLEELAKVLNINEFIEYKKRHIAHKEYVGRIDSVLERELNKNPLYLKYKNAHFNSIEELIKIILSEEKLTFITTYSNSLDNNEKKDIYTKVGYIYDFEKPLFSYRLVMGKADKEILVTNRYIRFGSVKIPLHKFNEMNIHDSTGIFINGILIPDTHTIAKYEKQYMVNFIYLINIAYLLIPKLDEGYYFDVNNIKNSISNMDLNNLKKYIEEYINNKLRKSRKRMALANKLNLKKLDINIFDKVFNLSNYEILLYIDINKKIKMKKALLITNYGIYSIWGWAIFKKRFYIPWESIKDVKYGSSSIYINDIKVKFRGLNNIDGNSIVDLILYIIKDINKQS